MDVVWPSDDDRRRSFEAFFEETSVKLMAQAYALTGNLQEAKDLTQETLTRAWQQWDVLARYDSPEAWARKVLHNLAVSRWRRLQLRHRYEASSSVGVVAAPDAEHLDLVRALRQLPPHHRRALVLHDLVGLTTDEVGAELGVRAETVRVWLHRGRKALAKELRWDDREDVEVSDRVRSRKP
ncbi:MAG: RNA polymerase sigma factor [Acidimicrobiales bacterium]